VKASAFGGTGSAQRWNVGDTEVGDQRVPLSEFSRRAPTVMHSPIRICW